MDNKPIWIGNDHGGYELKNKLIDFLQNKNIEVKNIGSGSAEIVRYPYYAARVAEAVSNGTIDRGILICSTGIGMSIVANRYKNVRASLCTNTYLASMTRAHNNSNILCIGGKITGEDLATAILETWLNTEYIGGRHDISLNLIKDAEIELYAKGVWNFKEQK